MGRTQNDMWEEENEDAFVGHVADEDDSPSPSEEEDAEDEEEAK